MHDVRREMGSSNKVATMEAEMKVAQLESALLEQRRALQVCAL